VTYGEASERKSESERKEEVGKREEIKIYMLAF
jgi:hypothetical protein